ncbi:MAG: SYNERG-CTERM sorting domain-containing protein [Myxococcales bacterium]|nr:SYNERG-CTERM sorting domain-containing protein [Myxococcales bacterium]
MVRAALLAAALLALEARSAEACSCPAEVGTLPAGGDPAVATNLRAIYFWGYGDDAYLVGPDQAPIRGPIETAANIRVLRLAAELAPDTQYTIRFSANLYNRPPVTFTTGAGPDREAPPSPVFEDFAIDWLGRDDNDSCGAWDYQIRGYLAAPAGGDIATMGMRFTPSTGEAREAVLWPGSAISGASGLQVWFPSQLGTTYCQNRFTLEKGETYLVEAWSIDRAGNTSEPVSGTFHLAGGDGGCSAGGRQALGTLLVLIPVIVRRRRAIVRG